MPEISIVIPCYNVKKAYLDACIDSILDQTFDSFEIIIVDDGSDFEFAQEIDKLSKRDDRIVICHQNNQGVSVARNTGVLMARGNYITFIDADDTVVSNFLEQAIEVAVEKDADVVYGFIRRIKEERASTAYSGLVNIQDVETKWLKKYHIGYLYSDENKTFGRGPIARLVKCNIAKNISFSKGVPIGEDILWNLELLKNTKKRILVNSVWYNYIIRSDSVTCRYEPRINTQLQPFYDMLKYYLDDEEDKSLYYNRIIYDLKSYVFKIYLGHEDNRDSFFVKWKKFNDICRERPWSEINDYKVFREGSTRKRVEWLLFRSRLLFPFMITKKKLKNLKKKLEEK